MRTRRCLSENEVVDVIALQDFPVIKDFPTPVAMLDSPMLFPLNPLKNIHRIERSEKSDEIL